mgnify:CR=1 FL=1
MRLRRLEIAALPGIRPGFALEGLGDGVHLVTGPNASGKSSLVRALRALLDPGWHAGEAVHVEAELETAGGERLHAARLGDDCHWRHADGTPAAPPPLPEPHLLDCYALHVEALTAAGSTEQAISRRLVRELAGGYDLTALTGDGGPFRLKRNHGEAEARRLAEARQAWQQRRHEHRALLADEQRLEELQQAYDHAEQARRRAEQLHRAAELAEARAQLAALDERLAEFPAGMAQLHGDELERLEHAEAERRGVQERLEALDEAEQACRRELEASGLAEAAPEREALAYHRRLLDELRERRRELRAAEEELEGARRRQAEIAEEIGVPEAAAVRVDPAALRRLEEQLEPYRRQQAHLAALDAELQRLGAEEHRPSLPRAATVRAGRQELLHWLAAPRAARPGTAAVAAGLAGAASPLGVAGAVYALEPQWQSHPGWAAAAVAGTAGLIYAAVATLRTPRADELRDAARRRYPAELPAPAAWAHEAVGEHLEALDELLEAAERRERYHQRAAERQQQARELERLHEALARQARQLGSDPGRLDTSTARFLQELREWDQARSALTHAAARRDERRADAEALRGEVHAFLEAWQTEPGAQAGAEALQSALDRLQGGAEQRQEALRRQEELHRQRAELERQEIGRASCRERVYTKV